MPPPPTAAATPSFTFSSFPFHPAVAVAGVSSLGSVSSNFPSSISSSPSVDVEIQRLLEYRSLPGFASSAQLLSHFLLTRTPTSSSLSSSSPSSPLPVPYSHYLLIGDSYSLHPTRPQFRRAVHYYRLAAAAHQREKQKAGKGGPTAAMPAMVGDVELQIQDRVLECQLGLQEHAAAFQTLESIPSNHRSLKHLVLLAHYYEKQLQTTLLQQPTSNAPPASATKRLISTYISILKTQPFAVVYIDRLWSLRVDPRAHIPYYTSTGCMDIINHILTASFHKHGHRHQALHTLYSTLLSPPSSLASVLSLPSPSASASASAITSSLSSFPFTYPCNLYLLLERARVEFHLCDWEVARQTLELVWKESNGLEVEAMDLLALLYRRRDARRELEDLVGRLMKTDDRCIQSWNAAALQQDLMYIQAKEVTTAAVQVAQSGGATAVAAATSAKQQEELHRRRVLDFLDRSLSIAPTQSSTLLIKAHILLASFSASTSALQCYKRVCLLEPTEILAWQGAIDCLLFNGQLKQALSQVNTVLSFNKRNPRLLTLVGLVLSSSAEGRQKAAKALMKAIALDPTFVDAILVLSGMLVASKQYDKSIELLEKGLAAVSRLSEWNTVQLHCKLGSVYASKGDIAQSLLHYQTANRLMPQFKTAQIGMQQIEQETAAAINAAVKGGRAGGDESGDDAEEEVVEAEIQFD